MVSHKRKKKCDSKVMSATRTSVEVEGMRSLELEHRNWSTEELWRELFTQQRSRGVWGTYIVPVSPWSSSGSQPAVGSSPHSSQIDPSSHVEPCQQSCLEGKKITLQVRPSHLLSHHLSSCGPGQGMMEKNCRSRWIGLKGKQRRHRWGGALLVALGLVCVSLSIRWEQAAACNSQISSSEEVSPGYESVRILTGEWLPHPPTLPPPSQCWAKWSKFNPSVPSCWCDFQTSWRE